jgi:hypothetical protein
VKSVPFLKNEGTYNIEQQGAEHLLTPSCGRLNFKKMSLQTSTWRLSRLEVPKRGVKRPLVGFKALWHLNILNAIRKLLLLQLPLSSNINMGPQRWYRCKIPSMALHLTRSMTYKGGRTSNPLGSCLMDFVPSHTNEHRICVDAVNFCTVLSNTRRKSLIVL